MDVMVVWPGGGDCTEGGYRGLYGKEAGRILPG